MSVFLGSVQNRWLSLSALEKIIKYDNAYRMANEKRIASAIKKTVATFAVLFSRSAKIT